MCDSLLTSSMIILVIAGLRLLFRNKVSSRLIYGLWLPVALWLLLSLPFGWGEESQFAAIRQFFQIPVLGITLGQLATILWIAGMLAMAIWFLAANLTFRKTLRSSREALDCPESPVPVWISPAVSTPCLFGLFRPAVYLTPDCAADPERRHHVLTHELTHLRHWDHVWNILRSLCLCVYWFHPPVWLAVHLSKQDSELACDEGALKRLGEEQRLAYGQTIVELAANSPRKDPLLHRRMMDRDTAPMPGAIKKQVFAAAMVFLVVSGALIGISSFRAAKSAIYNAAGEPIAQEDIMKTGECGRDLEWLMTRQYDLVILGTGPMYAYAENDIPWNVFADRIRSVSLPQGITAIDDYSFSGCKNLTRINIPDSVTFIGEGAFYGCVGLTSCVIPEGVEVIQVNTFYGCTSLRTIMLPTELKTIEKSAFELCKSLSAVTIPNAVTTIGARAFAQCSSLLAITIPDTVTTIGGNAFRSCNSLTQVTVPGSVKTFGNQFSYCAKLNSITLCEGVETVSMNGFTGCNMLKVLHIPASVTQIQVYRADASAKIQAVYVAPGNAAYTSDDQGVVYTKAMWEMVYYPQGRSGSYCVAQGCRLIGKYAICYNSNLTELTFPDSVQVISECAISECKNLTTLILPKTVNKINRNAFADSFSLRQLYILNPECQIDLGSPHTLGDPENTTIYSYTGSDAWEHAQKFNQKFVEISE